MLQTAAQAAPGTVLITYNECHIISTYETRTPSHSLAECKDCESYSAEELFLIQALERFGKTKTFFLVERLSTMHKPLSSASMWLEYFTEIYDKDMIRVFIRHDVTFMSEMADKILGIKKKAT